MELAGTLVLPAAITFTHLLIIAYILPHHTNTTVPLVFVLGLPSRSCSSLCCDEPQDRVYWVDAHLHTYLLSLPIWNGILPAYAFWHCDDFSWGQTRRAAGDKKHTGDKEGEFDSMHIVMMRWAEFEQWCRWKSGTQSRDSDEHYNP
ncbi:chitin synthase-domain-containing protein [Mycena crocata]|nr:chitin synthase-domain-containing protein [Mycena crocata]